MQKTGEFTRLLAGFRAGEAGSEAPLIELVYGDLRRMARKHLSGQKFFTLDTTALLSESYMRLVSPAARHVESRNHFFYLASRVMRQVVIDYARSRVAEAKRFDRSVTAEDALHAEEAIVSEAADLLRIDDALSKLAEQSERQARVVECRFFAGLTEEQTARALDTPLRTVQREWDRAREWLRQHLGEP